jgi:acyl-CoA thioesterase
MPDMNDMKNYIPEHGFTSFIGLELKSAEKGYAVVEVQLGPEHLNPQGVAHGGLVFSICDMAAGVAAIFGETMRKCLTIDASMHYLRPGRGKFLRAEGRVIKSGRNTAFSEAQLFDEEGRLVAKGEFTNFFVDLKKSE